MGRRAWPFLLLAALLGAGLWLALRRPPEGPSVTLYTSVDEEIAQDFARRFEAESGVRVDLVGDTEAAKTVGLANRLLEEGAPGKAPRADVFWNNEPMWAERLAERGILQAYASPSAADIPAEWKDPGGRWAANGLRARILIVHAPSLGDRKVSSYRDLAGPSWTGRASLARPVAGTTLSHMAALREALGAGPFEAWFRAMAANGTSFASGNGSLAREVGRGARAFGFTDTDDFAARKVAGEPVERVFPDQGEKEVGTFVLPVTVSVVRGAPHPGNARRLADWLLSPSTEAALSASSYASIPVRPGTRPGPGVADLASFRRAKVDWAAAGKNVDAVLDLTTEVMRGK